jgi:type IV pilus assembly protein PilW
MSTQVERLSYRVVLESPKADAGFTLVELMVSLAISVVILAALVAMFVSSSTRNREMATTNGLIENGRLAAQVLESDVVHAGFWGTHVPAFDDQTSTMAPADAPLGVPDPCLTFDPANWNDQYKINLIGTPVQVYDDAVICPGLITAKRANTDVLVVRHADTCSLETGSANCEAEVPGRLYFQSSLCLTDLEPYVFDTAGFNLRQRDCATPAERRKFVSNIYYIRDHAVTPGDGIPTLVRSEFDLSAGGALEQQPPVALIEGIEILQVELGVDDISETGAAVDYTAPVNWVDPSTRTSPTNRGDGVPDADFITCTTAAPCGVGELMNVTAVKLHILARAREPSRGYTDTKVYTLAGGATVGPFNDNFKRHVFVTTVQLPNFAGRRFTP